MSINSAIRLTCSGALLLPLLIGLISSSPAAGHICEHEGETAAIHGDAPHKKGRDALAHGDHEVRTNGVSGGQFATATSHAGDHLPPATLPEGEHCDHPGCTHDCEAGAMSHTAISCGCASGQAMTSALTGHLRYFVPEMQSLASRESDQQSKHAGKQSLPPNPDLQRLEKPPSA